MSALLSVKTPINLHPVEFDCYYVHLDYGVFHVRFISRGGFLITIVDTFNEVKKVSYIMLQGATLVDKVTYDNLYKKHMVKQILATKNYCYY